MKITVKKLQGGECNVEVNPNTTIIEIKKEIEKKLKISASEQKLLLLGRTLADDQNVSGYPALKDGSKLNLVVKKPEGLFDVAVKHFKKSGLSDPESVKASQRLLKIVQEKFNQMSWDDIERLSEDCMADDTSIRRETLDQDQGEVYIL